MLGSFAVNLNKRKIWIPRGCYELDLVALQIEICQFARQHDLAQNKLIETHFLSSLLCRSDYIEVVVNLIQLTCQKNYVIWHTSSIKYKKTFSNTFPSPSSSFKPFLLLCSFTSLNYFFVLFILYVIHHKNPLEIKVKHGMGHFGLYKPKCLRRVWYIQSEPSSTSGRWSYTKGLDGLWCVKWVLNARHISFDPIYSIRKFYGYK
jgi:hypothetical protein